MSHCYSKIFNVCKNDSKSTLKQKSHHVKLFFSFIVTFFVYFVIITAITSNNINAILPKLVVQKSM